MLAIFSVLTTTQDLKKSGIFNIEREGSVNSMSRYTLAVRY
jgi:hypothetical protein